jgi:helix-hairpin-helix protein
MQVGERTSIPRPSGGRAPEDRPRTSSRVTDPRSWSAFSFWPCLPGGAFYASRVSEKAPQVVYSASLEEIAAEVQQPLLVNINTADAERLDELPEVGPATAESILEYRRRNGLFESEDELVSV